MIFADVLVNFQQIFMKFLEHYFSKVSQQSLKFRKII